MPARRFSWERKHNLVPDPDDQIEVVVVDGLGIAIPSPRQRRTQALDRRELMTTVPRHRIPTR